MTRITYRIAVWAVLAAAVAGCRQTGAGAKAKPTNEGNKMSATAELERMLTEGDWEAVNLAQSLGDAAWPIIERGAGMPEYTSRQISMTCAKRLGGEASGRVLSKGLFDQNGNVRVAAAACLSSNPPTSAYDGVMKALVESQEEDIQELMALAAGYLPGDQTMETLRPMTEGSGVLAGNARAALAKLGDPEARSNLIQQTSSADGYTKYKALEDLSYVNDAGLAPHAKALLGDRTEALRIGPERFPKYRRVCDQAVDTLVLLLQLEPPFEASAQKIYSDDELSQVGELAQ